ncbi:succinate dehydrogenase, hydrophobic membrane anchor protein [Halomonas chromatireducens]|uniref:Succinate dehydrogenase hydrophobic membrane anchor subunit n=1 Tax=Halomonas chromatireducens TaxID=507626 RepID=A0A109UMT5_9GAMM|nr:succinate dehydrogenase, hydrophobic membrane anchor protein [Halomonas chromatireducens]AMD02106.1 Succinate dehydrogenase hydrophobic membrane anchor subunit [Halomonas chromatireducens]
MVTNITNLGRSGLSDWLIQRVSAVILALYTLFIVAYLLFNPGLDYYTWSGLFAQTWMRIFSLQALTYTPTPPPRRRRSVRISSRIPASVATSPITWRMCAGRWTPAGTAARCVPTAR